MVLTNKKAKEVLKNIEVPESLTRFAHELPKKDLENNENRENRIISEWDAYVKDEKKQGKFRSKPLSIALTSAAAIALVIGAGAYSPALAEIFFKIPGLSSQNEDSKFNVYDEVTAALKKEGVPVAFVANGDKSRGVYVFLEGDQAVVKKWSNQVKEITEEVLKSRQKYETYFYASVDVTPFEKPTPETIARDKELALEFQAIDGVMSKIVDRSAFQVKQEYKPRKVTVEMEYPLEVEDQKVAEAKKTAEMELAKVVKAPYEVKVHRYDKANREMDFRWGTTVVSAVGEELQSYKKYKTAGVSYKVADRKAILYLTLSLKSTDGEAKEHAEALKAAVEEFIQTKEVKDIIKDDPYQIIILGSDKKEILK